MTGEGARPEEPLEELFEDAPCGYLSTLPDGTIVRVNRTFEALTGHDRGTLVGTARFQDLLAPGDRIYHDTHYLPVLHLQGTAREIAVEILRPDGSRLPALVTSVLWRDEHGAARVVRTTVFDATERRRFERALIDARRRDEEIARRLQRSLLSGPLPDAPGLELGVAYRPGVSGLEVGGDWYDAFWLEEGAAVALVVGDVVGRGIEAAATMGQLRSAVRAMAAVRRGPAALLEALDRYARRHAIGRLATVVVAELELATGELRHACAGHPPPVVVAPGEDPRLEWDGRSPPLDAARRPAPRAEGRRRLAPGSAVVLYTDGLIERRSQTLDAGLARLLSEVGVRREKAVGALTQGLVRDLRAPDDPDDACVLAARVSAGVGRGELVEGRVDADVPPGRRA